VLNYTKIIVTCLGHVKFNINFSNVYECLYIFHVYDIIASVDHFTMSRIRRVIK